MLGEKDIYYTIKQSSLGSIYKDKGSKFIGYAFPVSTEDEVKSFLERLKKEHYAARHWCYAWRLGVENMHYRANDDGEPSNSAGKPIYGQILSKNLTNILVVVVRYYGGINLGVGGLIKAYKTAAQYCLEEAIIEKKTLMVNFALRTDYAHLNLAMRFIKEHHLKVITQKLDILCEINVEVKKSESLKMEQLLLSLPSINFTISKL